MTDQGRDRNVEPGREAGWGLLAGLVALALTLGLMILLSSPSAPKPKDAPLTEFSAGRAREIQANLLGEGVPHPVGSPANARVRERILATLRGLGLTPKVEESFICSRGGDCAQVANVVAQIAGREPGNAVLLMSHYDSVPAGPGTSDDLTGVAASLEIARILKMGPPPRHPVLLLLDDGEEEGLLGAEAFAAWSPEMADVGTVVNMEARGSQGPSLMFETSSPDALPVAVYAERAPKPFASSLFPTIYRFLPNDTDLTVFKTRGLPGLNFAFIGAPSHYHTSLDTLANSSLASLQHQGENALAAVRGLAESDFERAPRTDAVYFDLLHAAVVRWPAGLSPILGLLALVLNVIAAVFARRRGTANWGAVSLGLVAGLPALIVTLLLAFGLQALLAPAFPYPWVARPLPATVAFWLLALAATLWVSSLLGRRAPLAGLLAGVWILWSLLGLILGLALPGLSYLFLVPALVAGVCGLALGGSPGGRVLAAIVPAVVVGLLWFDILRFLYLGLGFTGFLITAVLLAIVFGTLIPLLPASGAVGRRWLPSIAAAGAVLAAVVAMVTPPYSPSSPRSLNLLFHESAGGGGGRWVIRGSGSVPEPLRNAARFATKPEVPFPWSPSLARAFVAPAPPLNAPGPELNVLSDSVSEGKRHLRLQLRSPRGAPIGIVYLPPEARPDSIKMNGQEMLLVTGRQGLATGMGGGWRTFSNFTLPPEGCEVELVLGATQPLDWYVVDRSPGLPPFGAELLTARNKAAAPRQEGDTTLVSRRVRI
jgi:peptidase M28-like protein